MLRFCVVAWLLLAFVYYYQPSDWLGGSSFCTSEVIGYNVTYIVLRGMVNPTVTN